MRWIKFLSVGVMSPLNRAYKTKVNDVKNVGGKEGGEGTISVIFWFRFRRFASSARRR
jgi:hypothetical protein